MLLHLFWSKIFLFLTSFQLMPGH